MRFKQFNQLKLGAILTYVSLILGNLISIIYTPIMLRILGQSEYGLYTLSNSMIGYLGVLNLGLGNSIIRYTSKYRANNDLESEYSLNGMFFIIYSILGLIVFILGSIFIFNTENIFSNTLNSIEIRKMKILLSIMLFNLSISFPFAIFDSIIVAYENFIFLKCVGIVRTIINPIIMIPLLFMGYKSVAITLLSTIINLGCIGLNIYYCFKILKIKIKFNNFNFSLLREISIYSFFIFLNVLVDKIYWNTDQFILGTIVSSSEVAVYSIGAMFNTYYMSFSTAISGVFLPKITKMVTKNTRDEEISNLFIKVGRIQFIVMSFILSGFLLIGNDFINLWAGLGYEDSWYIAIVVMIPLTVPLIQNIGISILQAKNMHKFRSKIYLFIAILNIFTTIPLCKIWGGIGAAISTGVSFFIGNIIIMNIYYYKKVNIDIPRFWREIFKMAINVLVVLLIVIGVHYAFNIQGVISVITKPIMLTILFSIVMWRFTLNEYEKNLIGQPILKIVKRIRGKI